MQKQNQYVDLLLTYSMTDQWGCVVQVPTLAVDIDKVRSALIAKDDELSELMKQASSGDETASAEVKKLKAEKDALQARLECKSRQLKVSQ